MFSRLCQKAEQDKPDSRRHNCGAARRFALRRRVKSGCRHNL